MVNQNASQHKVVGIDISKDYLDICILPSNKEHRYENNDKGIDSLCKGLCKEGDVLVIIEPSGNYERELQYTLLDRKIKVAKINAKQIRDFARACGKLAKTDSLDARILAVYGMKMEVRLLEARSDSEKRLHGLVCRRRQLSQMLSSEKNRLEKVSNEEAREDILKQCASLQSSIKVFDKKIRMCIKDDKALSEKRDVLCKYKGVGEVTSSVILAELPEIGRIEHEEISNLIGVVPINRDSGKMRGKRSIYGGRSTVRTALYMAAITAIRWDEKIGKFYKSLMAKGKPKKVAIVACMHKMIIILNARMRDFYTGLTVSAEV